MSANAESDSPRGLPVSYCANVHPGKTFDEAFANLKRYAAPLREKRGQSLAVGLWLGAYAIGETKSREELKDELKDWLQSNDIVTYTMNAFPFGNFHAESVKEEVYKPDWTDSLRVGYTQLVARVLADLLPDGVEGSISTVPLAFATHHPLDKDTSIYRPNLVSIARFLEHIHQTTGKMIRLAIEPEPGCVLETTEQAIGFFKSLWKATDGTKDEKAVREHLGLCYDVCHQAVEYESIADSMQLLDENEIRIVKLHLSCAIELSDPSDDEARNELSRFAEPRYLHQTFAEHPSGRLLKLLDLSRDHALSPSAEWRDSKSWRIHFHVPVHKHSIGRLKTTRPQLEEAIAFLSKLSHQPHLEVETYTWNVLPTDDAHPVAFDLVEGLAAELASIDALLDTKVGSVG